MRRKILSISIIILFICTIAALGTFVFLSRRTIPNDENAIGNTAGNLLNGGLFCEKDGKIYFSNPKDRNSLYVMNSDMTKYKKLSDDDCSYINCTNQYLIYARNNHKREGSSSAFLNLNANGIVRINKKDGENLKLLYDNPSLLVSLKGNMVYYQHYNADEGLRFHQVGINASDDLLISEEPIVPASFSGNNLYYNGVANDHNIYSMNLDDNSSSVVYSGNCFNVMAHGDYLYFLALENNYAIARTDLDGGNPEIIVNERCSFFNISPDGNYLYYQVDGGDNNRLCQIDLSTLKSETIQKGDYNSIHVTKNYVFFRTFNKTDFQYINTLDGSIHSFNPEIITSK